MVPHCDHNEHDVDVVVTEQGLADLRGLAPRERATLIIETCAHPLYRDLLARLLPAGIAPWRTNPSLPGTSFELAYPLQ